MSPTAVDEARKRFAEGRGDDALSILDEAARRDPEDRAVRSEYYRLRDILVSQWIVQAEALRSMGQLEAAEALYKRSLARDSENGRATGGLENLVTDRRRQHAVTTAEALIKAERFQQAQEVLAPVLADHPQHRAARRLQRIIDERVSAPSRSVQLRPPNPRPVSLELRDVPVRSVFEVLQRATGITFLMDSDVRSDQRTSIAVRNATVEDAIRMVLLTGQLQQRILNSTTVFIYPNTPQKVREHQELILKGFYVANADVKQTANMVRTLLKTRDVFMDEKIGLLVIKDTPEVIRLAERLIAAQDLAEPEVMLEVEILEVSRSRLQELGIRFPDTLAIGLKGAAGPGMLTLSEWRNRSSDIVQLTFSDPLFLLSLKQQDGVTNVLANPRIRVKNKDKARIHIGDRVPVITTTAAATGGFISESVTYLDVGLKLEVEPMISLEDEVAIKVGLEVSSIVREIRGAASNTLTYQVGTRNAATNLRLKDGETQVLAGLISDEERRTADRVPGLGDLPVAGRLFSHTRDNSARTEIVLLMTPRLVRSLARPDAAALEFAAGTEASGGTRPSVGIAPTTPATPPPLPTPGEPGPTPPESTPPPVDPRTMVPFGGVKPPAQ